MTNSPLISFIDLTSLNETDTPAQILSLCHQAKSLEKPVAAICVFSQFISIAAVALANTGIKIAAVANFPAGAASLDTALTEINQAIAQGATEIDVVCPYSRYLAGDQQLVFDFIQACKTACGNDITLKVILETGKIRKMSMIRNLSHLAIMAGADFIKTSTGKIAEGASLEAAGAMLSVIHELTPKLHRRPGIKIAGGIRSRIQAEAYVTLAKDIMGDTWLNANTFRIGASQISWLNG